MSRFISAETMTIGVLAIVFGLAGAYGVRALLSEQPEVEEEKEQPKPTFRAPFAIQDLPVDRVLTPSDMAMRDTTTERLREKGYDPQEVIITPQNIVGRRVRVPLKQGEYFRASALYPQGTGPDLAERLKDRYRAVDLFVADLSDAAIQPGSYVDVLFRTYPESGDEGIPPIPEMTVAMLEVVEVLDVRRDDAPGGRGAEPNVTLAIPVEDVGKFRTVAGHGEFYLVARNPDDTARYGPLLANNLTLEEVLGIEMPPPPPAPPSPFQTVIWRRTSPQVNTFYGDSMAMATGSQAVSAAYGEPGYGNPSAGLRGTRAARGSGGCKNCGKPKRVPTGSVTPQPLSVDGSRPTGEGPRAGQPTPAPPKPGT